MGAGSAAAMTTHGALPRLQRLFSLSLPPLIVCTIVYVGLSNAVFGLATLVGKRLRPSLRGALRRAYLWSTGLIAATCGSALLVSCASTGDPCVEGQWPLQDARCFGVASATVVALLTIFAADRVFVLLLGIDDVACALTLHARAARAAAIAVSWMGLAEQCSATVALLLLLAARRAFARAELMCALAGTVLKAYQAISVVSLLVGACGGSKRLTVAATTATFLN